jgi:hypothetical protein
VISTLLRLVPSSASMAGKAGRYMSVEIGPTAVRKPRSRGSQRGMGIRSRRLGGGGCAVVRAILGAYPRAPGHRPAPFAPRLDPGPATRAAGSVVVHGDRVGDTPAGSAHRLRRTSAAARRPGFRSHRGVGCFARPAAHPRRGDFRPFARRRAPSPTWISHRVRRTPQAGPRLSGAQGQEGGGRRRRGRPDSPKPGPGKLVPPGASCRPWRPRRDLHLPWTGPPTPGSPSPDRSNSTVARQGWFFVIAS